MSGDSLYSQSRKPLPLTDLRPFTFQEIIFFSAIDCLPFVKDVHIYYTFNTGENTTEEQ